jgi:hypothetical protein
MVKCVRFSVFYCLVLVETLRWAGPPSKESYQTSKGVYYLKMSFDL